MKKLAKVTGLVLAAACVMGMSACGEKPAIGKDYTKATSQLDALMKLDKGEADVAVIDSVMAGYYTTTGEYASKMTVVEGLVLAEEEYGIAAKKGSEALMNKINEALISIRTEEYATLTAEYGLTGSIALTETTTNPYQNATDSSWTDLVEREGGKIVIGYTLFAPIAMKEGAELTGFDIELARAVIAELNEQNGCNLEADFQLIDWSTKEAKLEDGTIDLVWNGMTITPERATGMCISVPYLYNKQVAVVLNEDATKYSTVESMANAIMTAEGGSAGETVIMKGAQ